MNVQSDTNASHHGLIVAWFCKESMQNSQVYSLKHRALGLLVDWLRSFGITPDFKDRLKIKKEVLLSPMIGSSANDGGSNQGQQICLPKCSLSALEP